MKPLGSPHQEKLKRKGLNKTELLVALHHHPDSMVLKKIKGLSS